MKFSTYSGCHRELSIAYLASPPRNAMSVPGRMGTWMSAISADAERSGSTTIHSAPASRARSIQRRDSGWLVATSAPKVSRQSVFAMSLHSPSGSAMPRVAATPAAKARRPEAASESMFTTPQDRSALASRNCSSATRRAPPKLPMARVRMTGTPRGRFRAL